jgi:hypothetical protein
VSDRALLAKGQLLWSDPDGDGSTGIGHLGKRHAHVKRSLKGRADRADLLLRDAAILHLHVKRQQPARRDRRVQAKSVSQ